MKIRGEKQIKTYPNNDSARESMRNKILILSILACLLSLLFNISQINICAEKENSAITEEVIPYSCPAGVEFL